ncbi:MAG: acetyl-CoA carboxylase biotin carboxyl carrier protein subunit [Fimbriimonas sp.]
MRRTIDGLEMILEPGSAKVERLPDRLIVHTAEGSHTALTVSKGDSLLISYRGQTYQVDRKPPARVRQDATVSGRFHAPMPGAIVDVAVKTGDVVTKGQKLVVLEAMKMQQPSVAPFDGTVASIGVSLGDQVAEGAFLVEVHPANPNS